MVDRKWARPLAVAGLCLGLSACAFQSRLQGVAVNHNEMVASAANEVTLLNILRARGREPLQFTSISKLTGSATASGKASGSVAAKGPTPTAKADPTGKLLETSTLAGTEVVTPALEASVTAASSFDIGVFDTQEFYQGIITSVPPGIVAHYLHQGWPEEMLTMLFISSVDIVATADTELADGRVIKKGQAVRSIENSAAQGHPGRRMSDFIRCYGLVSYGRETVARPIVQVKALKVEVAGLGVLDGEKYDVDELVTKPDPETHKVPDPGDRWVSRKGKTSDALMIMLRKPTEEMACAALFDVAGLLKGGGVQSKPDFRGVSGEPGDEKAMVGSFFVTPAEDKDPANKDKAAAKAKFEIQLTMRSVDGVIYYLGECLRTRTECSPVLGKRKIFVLSNKRVPGVFTSAEFHGERFYVPTSKEKYLGPILKNGEEVEQEADPGENDGGRSSQVIDLIQQLLNLQKSSKDRPATATVRVVQ